MIYRAILHFSRHITVFLPVDFNKTNVKIEHLLVILEQLKHNKLYILNMI